MLVHLRDIVQPARQRGYAVGAFNTFGLETTQAIVQAAANQQSPVIIQATESSIRYAGLRPLFEMVRYFAEQYPIPVAIHLDHGRNLALIQQAISIGFSSVMIDGSHLPFAENVAMTKEVVDFAHSHGCWVQAEIGRLPGTEDYVAVTSQDAWMTDPAEAVRFVEQTGLDALAVSVGTLHGPIKLQQITAKLDIPRIEKISQLTNKPLVLHGASHVSVHDLQAAAYAGVDIVNIDTDLRLAFTQTLRQTLTAMPEELDARKYLAPSIEAVQKVVEAKMEALGSSLKA